MKLYFALIGTFLFIQIHAQENRLSIFDPLIGKTWKAEGEWGDGSKFKQEVNFRYSLDSTLVIAKSKGFTNKDQTTFGPRNHGIRKFDTNTNSIKFWEFDVFGGTTEGTVRSRGKDMLYTYAYGATTITDYWEYVNENTYNFTVGAYKEGVWEQTYLKTQFIADSSGFNFQFDHYSLVVSNLLETGDFYRDILKLTEIPHPDKAPGFRWFGVSGNSQLHLIEKEMADFKRDKSLHLCVATQDLDGLISHLRENNVDFYDWPGTKNAITHRSDGVKQIYIQDPEDNWIEINNAKH